MQKSFFTTQNLCPEKRLGAWKESIATLFDVAPAREAASASCPTTVNSFLIDSQIMISGCSTHAQRFERQSLKIAQDSLDHYVIQTHLSGAQELQNGKKPATCEPGDLLVLDLAEKHDAVTTAFIQRSLVIPRRMLAPHLKDPDSQAGRVLKADSPLTALAVNHLKCVFNLLGAMSEKEAMQVVQPTLLLAAGALNGSLEQVQDGGAAASASLLVQAKTEIERNLQRLDSIPKCITN